jgi:hypothetical protein
MLLVIFKINSYLEIYLFKTMIMFFDVVFVYFFAYIIFAIVSFYCCDRRKNLFYVVLFIAVVVVVLKELNKVFIGKKCLLNTSKKTKNNKQNFIA